MPETVSGVIPTTVESRRHEVEKVVNGLVDTVFMATIEIKVYSNVPLDNKVKCVLDDAVNKVIQNLLATNYAKSTINDLTDKLEQICVSYDQIDLLGDAKSDSTFTDNSVLSDSGSLDKSWLLEESSTSSISTKPSCNSGPATHNNEDALMDNNDKDTLMDDNNKDVLMDNNTSVGNNNEDVLTGNKIRTRRWAIRTH